MVDILEIGWRGEDGKEGVWVEGEVEVECDGECSFCLVDGVIEIRIVGACLDKNGRLERWSYVIEQG